MGLTPRELAEIDGKPMALAWIGAAEAALGRPTDALTEAALATNFAFGRLDASEHASHLVWIRSAYGEIRRVLDRSHVFFADVSERDAMALFRPAPGADIPPAYAIGGDRVYFTPRFAPFDPVTKRGYGPKCRAAMVIHESVHIFDGRSGEPEIHLTEWDPRFNDMTPEQQLHNASAYASFAAQTFHRVLEWSRDVRYGAGRPSE